MNRLQGGIDLKENTLHLDSNPALPEGDGRGGFFDWLNSTPIAWFWSDRVIFGCMMALIVIGLVMVTSVRLSAFGSTASLLASVLKESGLAAGGLAMGIVSAVFYRNKRHHWILYPVSIIFLILMFGVAKVAPEVNGARCWIYIGSFSIQPSEFGKPLLIMLMAASLKDAEYSKSQPGFFRLMMIPALFYVAMAIAILMQKDFGTLVILTLIFGGCFLAPAYPALKKPQKYLKGLAIVLLAAGIVYCSFDSLVAYSRYIPGISHVATRVENMKDPYADYFEKGFQPANALYGMADGGFFGKGIGKSNRKYGFLTEAESDYIGAVIIEETGVAGIGAVITLYCVIIWRLFRYALMTKSRPDKVILIGTAIYIFAHLFVNLGGITCLIPMTGVPLLMVSKGGSAMIAICIMLGIAQNRIARLKEKE